MKKFLVLISLCIWGTLNAAAQHNPFALAKTARNVRRVPTSSLADKVLNDVMSRTRNLAHVPALQLPLFSTSPSPMTTRIVSKQLLSGVSSTHSLLTGISLKPLEANINRYLFTVSSKANPDVPLGSGFTVANFNADGSLELMGVTTAGVAQKTGEEVMITFHTPEGNIPFEGRIVLSGHPQDQNIALIELPAEVTRVALPVEVPTRQDRRFSKTNALAYWISSDGRAYKSTHRVVFTNGTAVLAQTEQGAATATESGGLVVDEQGQLLGLYHTTHPITDKDESFIPPFQRKFWPKGKIWVSEFVSASRLERILHYYNTLHIPAARKPRVVIFGMQKVGVLAMDEAVVGMDVFYPHRKPVRLTATPFWTPATLEQFVPDVQQAQSIHIHIATKNQGRRTYILDKLNGQIYEEAHP